MTTPVPQLIADLIEKVALLRREIEHQKDRGAVRRPDRAHRAEGRGAGGGHGGRGPGSGKGHPHGMGEAGSQPGFPQRRTSERLALTLDDLRSAAIARSLFRPVSLQEAVDRLGFVQADPIRAPARAQDLTLRHRVAGYRAGDLETRYQELDVHEDVFVNYGFVSRDGAAR